jgi:hypothetical protein
MGRERGRSSDNTGWDWEECLRMGRGNATLIEDIKPWGVGVGTGGNVSRRKRTWEMKV